MKRIKLVEKKKSQIPNGAACLVNIFANHGFTITMEQGSHLCVCLTSEVPWETISKSTDEEIFALCEPHYYVDHT